jgi:hypothetical protein
VQTPGGISMFYDYPFGHRWQRNIIMDGSTHLPANIRQWFGDSRGHREGSTLVIDVTNFSPKTEFLGSRELASDRTLDADWPDHAGICRDHRRPDGVDPAMDRGARSSASRASKRTKSIMSRAVLREIIRSLRSCGGRASRNSPSRRDEVLIREPGTTPREGGAPRSFAMTRQDKDS